MLEREEKTAIKSPVIWAILWIVFVVLVLIVLISGGVWATGNCALDTYAARIKAQGSPATIICYSGGKLIYRGRSTGRVKSPSNSDGYLFKDAKTGKLTEVSGNCVIVVQ